MYKLFCISVFILLMSNAFSQNWLDNGLLCYYPLDSLSGYDSTGNGNDLTWNTATNSQNNRFNVPNRAVEFNSGEHGIQGFVDTLPKANTPRSFSLWLYPSVLPSASAVGFPFFYGKRIANQGMGLAYRNNGKLIFASYTDGTLPDQDLESKGTMQIQTWTHIGLTYNGDTAKIYINGVLDTLGFRLWNTNTGMLHFGRMGFGGGGQTAPIYYFPYKGILDDFRIYNKELNAHEIWMLANDNFGLTHILDNDNLSKEVIQIYPNPTSKGFKIISKEKIESVTMLNTSAKRVLKFHSEMKDYDISSLRPGIYIAEIKTLDKVHFIKVIKEY